MTEVQALDNQTAKPIDATADVAVVVPQPGAAGQQTAYQGGDSRQERPYRQSPGQGRGGQRQGRRGQDRESKDGFDTRLMEVRRVSRMYKGGRRMRMSVLVACGNREGQVGVAIAKGADVALAQNKAAEKAKKNLIVVPLKGNTIPHEVMIKFKSTRVLLKPAAPGTGVIAGATVKSVLELAGIKDALTKVLGSTNTTNVATATMIALKSLRSTRL